MSDMCCCDPNHPLQKRSVKLTEDELRGRVSISIPKELYPDLIQSNYNGIVVLLVGPWKIPYSTVNLTNCPSAIDRETNVFYPFRKSSLSFDLVKEATANEFTFIYLRNDTLATSSAVINPTVDHIDYNKQPCNFIVEHWSYYDCSSGIQELCSVSRGVVGGGCIAETISFDPK